jgi:hypothetical protein
MTSKQRLSVSVDPEVIEAGQAAVAQGTAPNLSAWVNDALLRQAEHERRLAAVDAFLASHEAEFGALTTVEVDGAIGRLRDTAIRVRNSGTIRPAGRRR